MKPIRIQKKKVWAWAVIWTDEAMGNYGVLSKDRIRGAEGEKEWIPYALFEKRKEAKASVNGNPDFKVTRCIITLP